ncbi:MAG: thioredoxin-disulfide reductase [Acidobacteriota bacterium]
MVRKTIILGSGCAGSTAAIYAARADLEPLVLEGHEPGGQLSLTTLVENYPGFPEGITGPELVENMKKQAQRFGAEYRMERARRVEVDQRPFVVETDENQYTTQSIIVASGASARMLGLEGERRLLGYGVSTCATCDGYFFRNQRVVVVGGGDTAMEDSLYLTKHASHVTIIHRREELRASKIMAERAKENPKISFLWDTVVVDILDPEKKQVEAVRLKNVKTGEESLLETDGVFVAIGHKPNTDIFEGILDRDENGYLKVSEGARTNVEGIFAAGDVHDHVYRQAVTAAGAGCRAAIECERYVGALEAQVR